ncbi:lysylphosphatidylglycerol synthase transmembrane domain-containing protein [Achromobacter sp. NCFB-sbj8-Ac1-l]|uniref:lysylphosphatidylglycerol synthase transmembrane domain-containing protein n=1 Tax=unclassified Achromobacter TaxID=2626865 RepID=UPI00404696D7
MTAASRQGAARWFKHMAGAGVTVLCLVVFLRQVNISDVLDALAHFHWAYLALGIASLAAGYALRIVRWSMMLRAAGTNITFSNCCAPFLGSIALNNVLPLRLGDVVRALVFPRSMGITKTIATSSLIVERLVDLMTLLASLAIGLFAIRAIAIPEALKASAVSLAIAGGVVLALGFFFSGALGRLLDRMADRAREQGTAKRAAVCGMLAGLLHGFNVMSRPRLLLSMLAVSMLVWVGEAGLFYFVLLGAGVEGSPVVALLVMAVATLSTLVPSSPGYVGPFHLAAFTAISLVGGTAAQAGSYAVIVHLALWLPTTLAGAVAIWARPELFRAAKSQAG